MPFKIRMLPNNWRSVRLSPKMKKAIVEAITGSPKTLTDTEAVGKNFKAQFSTVWPKIVQKNAKERNTI